MSPNIIRVRFKMTTRVIFVFFPLVSYSFFNMLAILSQ